MTLGGSLPVLRFPAQPLIAAGLSRPDNRCNPASYARSTQVQEGRTVTAGIKLIVQGYAGGAKGGASSALDRAYYSNSNGRSLIISGSVSIHAPARAG